MTDRTIHGDAAALRAVSRDARLYAAQASRRAQLTIERSMEALGRLAVHTELLRDLASAIVASAASPAIADVLLERGLEDASVRSVHADFDEGTSEIVVRIAVGAREGPRATPEIVRRDLAAASARAVSERALLYQVERRSRQLLQAVVDQLPLGLIVVQPPDGHVALANNLAREILSLGAVARLERDAVAALRPDGTPYAPEEWPAIRALLAGEVVHGETLDLPATRERGARTIEMSAVPVRGADGGVVAAVATVEDVTEARQAEAARSAFVGILSHELKSPLTAIFGGAKVVELHGDELRPEVRTELLHDVASETERLHRLVENLLVLARVESGVQAASPEPVLLQHVVPGIVTHEAAEFPAARFETSIDPGLPLVMGDEASIDQALGNLLSNAAKYGGEAGPIQVRVETVGDEVAVRVLDAGPGLSDEASRRVFRLFYRSEEARRTAPGAGIGLFVAARLVESIGGRIWGRRRPEGGAEFGFALPRVADEDGDAD